MLLIFPPVAKPCELPAGIARLAGALKANGHHCRLLDANLECLLWLIGNPVAAGDTWTRRAAMHRTRHLESLREPDCYRTPDRYRRSVSDLNRLLNLAGQERGVVAGFSDFQDSRLSPLRSADLLRSAEQHEQNLFAPWFSQRLPELLGDDDSVGFSLNYLSQALATFAMIGFVRKHFPGLRIVVGGGLATSWVRRPGWTNPFGGLVDEIVAGAGEAPLLSLLGSDDPGKYGSLPDYSGLPLEQYLSPGLILPYSASSGCYWNRCSFCPELAEGNSYCPVPPKQALAEMNKLSIEYRPALVHILDNAISPALLDLFQDSAPGAPWYGFARFSRELADPDYCRGLKNSGCVMLKLGLESGDQGVLDRLHKGIDLGVASRILENLRQAGIGVYLYLLFGTPAETLEDARQTLAFVRAHHESIGFLNLALFNMPLSSMDAAACATEPFYDGDLSLYTGFRHPQGWDRREVRGFLEREFKREPLVAAILRRDPPLFTSNHAPFFC
ncbi:radical SAM protein [Geobacter sp. OR-1]|uniref:B12-binding domain-containing radical SAM protein n=1 Tax=Geobacter sp. OR-1 TaxID=1266765 RepID=UPI0005A6C101|nr:B12-binding domain-containing radical SAM protein [Geobacter sp. OR-1]